MAAWVAGIVASSRVKVFSASFYRLNSRKRICDTYILLTFPFCRTFWWLSLITLATELLSNGQDNERTHYYCLDPLFLLYCLSLLFWLRAKRKEYCALCVFSVIKRRPIVLLVSAWWILLDFLTLKQEGRDLNKLWHQAKSQQLRPQGQTGKWKFSICSLVIRRQEKC